MQATTLQRARIMQLRRNSYARELRMLRRVRNEARTELANAETALAEFAAIAKRVRNMA